MQEYELINQAQSVFKLIFQSVHGVVGVDIRKKTIQSVIQCSPLGFTATIDLASGSSITFIIELKAQLSIALLKQVEERMVQTNSPDAQAVILCSTYMSNQFSRYCHEHSINYFDLSGNCAIYSNNLLIKISGNKNRYPASNRAFTSIFERTSDVSSTILRILFRDLTNPWKTQALADAAKCSIGQVAKVKKFMSDNDWIEDSPKGFRISSPDAVLRAWSKTYLSKKDQVISCYSLDSISMIEMKLQKLQEEKGIKYYLTGFSGGVRYVPVVRYNKVQVYIERNMIDVAIPWLGCKKVDSGANVEFIIPHSTAIFADHRVIHGEVVVSPVQVYLDLIQQKNRGEELAQAVYKKEIVNEG